MEVPYIWKRSEITNWLTRLNKSSCLKQESKAISWNKTNLCGFLIVWVIVWMHFCRQGWWVGGWEPRRSISGEIWSQSGGGGHLHTSTLPYPRITPQAAATHKWPGAPECHWPRDNLCNASASWLHWVALTQWWCTGCQRHHPPIKLFQINCTAPWLHCTELCITITTSAPRDGKRSKNAVRPKIVRSLQPESNNKVEHLVPNLKFVSALK